MPLKCRQNRIFDDSLGETLSYSTHTHKMCQKMGSGAWDVPVMAAIAVRKKVVSIGHFSPSFCLQSLQRFLFVRSNQVQLYVLIVLKIREK